MRNKYVAAFLAMFFGSLGLHRFYLGRVGLGILYVFLFLTGISALLGVIDALIFLSMSTEAFNKKYNAEYLNQRYGENKKSFDRSYQDYKTKQPPTNQPIKQAQGDQINDLRQSSIQKFKNFDLNEAIVDFEKIRRIAPKDIANLFNLACAYSLAEKPQSAFDCIDKAISLGFKDYNRLKTHDALAFLRSQPEWPRFEANKYQLPAPNDHSDLLSQLSQLRELRDRGMLTEEEFNKQAEKIKA